MALKNENSNDESFAFDKPKRVSNNGFRIRSKLHVRVKTQEEILRIRSHRRSVKIVKEIRESTEQTLKILSVNQQKVNELHEIILKKQIQNINQFKKKINSWLNLLLIARICSNLYIKFTSNIRKKAIMELKQFYAMKIQHFLSKKKSFSVLAIKRLANLRLHSYLEFNK